MKIYIYSFLVGVVFLFNGCSLDDHDENRYHLVNQNGYGIANVKYVCSGRAVHLTDGSGGFYFYEKDDCSLKLDLAVDSVRDFLFIENDHAQGIANIPYECDSGKFGRTDIRGHFEYDNIYQNDVCTFQL